MAGNKCKYAPVLVDEALKITTTETETLTGTLMTTTVGAPAPSILGTNEKKYQICPFPGLLGVGQSLAVHAASSSFQFDIESSTPTVSMNPPVCARPSFSLLSG